MTVIRASMIGKGIWISAVLATLGELAALLWLLERIAGHAVHP